MITNRNSDLMETKKFTQFGTFSVVVLLPIFILCLVLFYETGFDDLAPVIILGFVILTILFCLLTFYKITITIDDTYLSFRLGIGLISRKFRMADIKTCQPVKNNPFYGIGIRLISHGWLYNVSGLKAIELTFKNRNSVVRIGTDKPDEIASIVNGLIEKEKFGSTSFETNRSYTYLTLAAVLIALILPVGIILSGKQEIKIDMTDSGFSFKGMYGMSVNYSDISQLDTIHSLPPIKLKTNGYAFGKTLKGNFTLKDKTKVKLFVTKETPPYIYMKEDGINLYINFKDPARTINLYDALKNKVNK